MVNTRFRNAAPALITFMAFLIAMTWAADHADADSHVTVIEFTGEDFYIPRPAEATDQEGVERLLASIDVPAELVGLTCSVAGTSANGESVHPNNYGMIRSNGDTVRISGTEDEASGVRLSDRVIVLGATVDLYNIMLPDADGIVATSVSYTVRVTCTDDTTTTSTTLPTTSTSSSSPSTSTSTSVPTQTTTTPPATSTTAPTESTTTTSPPNTSTTGPGSSTSTTVPTTGSTEPPTSTPDPTLPNTGPPVDAAGLAMAGIALLALGGGLVRAVRENR